MKCEKCGCEDIQINEAWDKTIELPEKYKWLFVGGAILLVLVTVGLFNVNFIAGLVGLILTVGYIGGGSTWYAEWRKTQKKKSHSKCICKHCGYTWYID